MTERNSLIFFTSPHLSILIHIDQIGTIPQFPIHSEYPYWAWEDSWGDVGLVMEAKICLGRDPSSDPPPSCLLLADEGVGGPDPGQYAEVAE